MNYNATLNGNHRIKVEKTADESGPITFRKETRTGDFHYIVPGKFVESFLKICGLEKTMENTIEAVLFWTNAVLNIHAESTSTHQALQRVLLNWRSRK